MRFLFQTPPSPAHDLNDAPRFELLDVGITLQIVNQIDNLQGFVLPYCNIMRN